VTKHSYANFEDMPRIAAVACHAKGEGNCRHGWNAAHPNDEPITVAEQEAFEDSTLAKIKEANR
jgi:hypothetical protein